MNTKYLIPQSFITTSDFNRLAKRMSDARIKEAARLFVNKSHVNNAFDIADKNRENKPQKFDLVVLLVEVTLRMMDHKII